MDNKTNLIYNGNFQYGEDGWLINSHKVYDPSIAYNGSYGGIKMSAGAGWSTLYSKRIQINTADTYNFKFDVKSVSGGTAYCYCYIPVFDRYGTEIAIYLINHHGDTTLAQELKDGDTQVVLTNASGFYLDTKNNYYRIGICDSPAWGYNRSLIQQKYCASATNTSTNTIILNSAWTGGTWKVGTPVARFNDGGTYIYPTYWSSPAYEWLTKSRDLGPSMWRFSATECVIGQSIGANWVFDLTNYELTNNTRYQEREYNGDFQINGQKPSILKSGIAEGSGMNEIQYRNVRYIRDWCSGSTANSAHHWCEIQAWDKLGRNVAYAAVGSGVTNGGVYQILGSHTRSGVNNSANANYIKTHAITKGTPSPSSTYIGYGSNAPTAIVIDLGQVFQIEKIIVWHYWGDGRTYGGTKTEISTDNENWETVFDSSISGTYPETISGNTITFGSVNANITNGGYYNSNRFYEI